MRVLVLCHGNINRSPLVEALLKQKGCTVKSAGFVGPGKRAAKKMRDAAKQLLGIDLEKHRSQVVTPDLWNWSDIVLYMDGGNKRRILTFQSSHHRNLEPRQCVNLGFWYPEKKNTARVPDPNYIARGPEFDEVVERIDKTVTAWAKEYLK